MCYHAPAHPDTTQRTQRMRPHRLQFGGLRDEFDNLVEEQRPRKLHARVEQLQAERRQDASAVAEPDGGEDQPASLALLCALQNGRALRGKAGRGGGEEIAG